MKRLVSKTAEDTKDDHFEYWRVRGVELSVDGSVFEGRPGILVECDVPGSIVIHVKDDRVFVSPVEVAGCAANARFERAQLADEALSNAMDASVHIRVIDEGGAVYSHSPIRSRPRIHFIVPLGSPWDTSA